MHAVAASVLQLEHVATAVSLIHWATTSDATQLHCRVVHILFSVVVTLGLIAIRVSVVYEPLQIFTARSASNMELMRISPYFLEYYFA